MTSEQRKPSKSTMGWICGGVAMLAVAIAAGQLTKPPVPLGYKADPATSFSWEVQTKTTEACNRAAAAFSSEAAEIWVGGTQLSRPVTEASATSACSEAKAPRVVKIVMP